MTHEIITPILIRTSGRSGSTLIMQILASSARIAFDRIYPFEVRHLSYLMRSAEVLSKNDKQNIDLPFDWNQEFVFKANPQFVGPLPATSRMFNPAQYAKHLQRGLYSAFESQLKEGNPNLTHYAEKMPSDDIIDVLKNIRPCKLIYNIRDPRDQMASIMAFNKKRASFGFGWKEDDSQESFAKRFARQQRAYLQRIIELEANPSDDHIVLRYERLVTKQKKEIQKISKWLDVPVSHSFIKKNKEHILEQHSTSDSAEASVAKWKTVLSEKSQAIFEKNLGEELNLLYGQEPEEVKPNI